MHFLATEIIPNVPRIISFRSSPVTMVSGCVFNTKSLILRHRQKSKTVKSDDVAVDGKVLPLA